MSLCFTFKLPDEPKQYVSSSRGSSTVQQLKIIEDIVMSIMAEDDAWPFLKPVLKRDVCIVCDILMIVENFYDVIQIAKIRLN